MVVKPPRPPPRDDEVRALLERYECPVPFHTVRTRLLGSIAAPVASVLPMKVMADLWGGRLPTFHSVEAANELLYALMMGLWNRLTRHQNRDEPFRLLRIETKATCEELTSLALTRCQEVDGFVEGLFAGQASIDLTRRAELGLGKLADIRVMLAVVVSGIAVNPRIVGTKREIETTLTQLRSITRVVEREIHAIMIACALARRQSLASISVKKPTLH